MASRNRTEARQGASAQRDTEKGLSAAETVAGAGPSGTSTQGSANAPPGPVAATGPGPAAAAPIEKAKTSCLMNARYHASREAFLDTVHRWFMFGIIAFGAGALVDILPPGKDWLKSAFAAATALLGALDLTFDLSNRARMHALMKRRYLELLADLTEGRQQMDGYEAEIHRFGADEEPVFHALLCSCWNFAQQAVYGRDALLFKIPRHHLVLKNVLRFTSVQYLTIELKK